MLRALKTVGRAGKLSLTLQRQKIGVRPSRHGETSGDESTAHGDVEPRQPHERKSFGEEERQEIIRDVGFDKD